MLVLHLDVGVAHALYIYTNSRFVTGFVRLGMISSQVYRSDRTSVLTMVTMLY